MFALSYFIIPVLASLIFQVRVGLLCDKIPVFQDKFYIVLSLLLREIDANFFFMHFHIHTAV